MRVIIAGSRTIKDFAIVSAAVAASGLRPDCVVCGGAAGVDALGERWAQENGVPVQVFRADWAQFGRSAGAIRNAQMAQNADALVLVWDGASAGSKNMLQAARKAGLQVFEFRVPPPNFLF
jgi:hypothetical protein